MGGELVVIRKQSWEGSSEESQMWHSTRKALSSIRGTQHFRGYQWLRWRHVAQNSLKAQVNTVSHLTGLFLCCWGIEPRVSYMQDKHCTAELHPLSFTLLVLLVLNSTNFKLTPKCFEHFKILPGIWLTWPRFFYWSLYHTLHENLRLPRILL